MYSDPYVPGLWWRDDSPEDTATRILTSLGVATSFKINTEPFLTSIKETFQKFQPISLDAVGPLNGLSGILAPGTLTEWQDDAHSGQDDAPVLPVCPAHGTLPRSGLCRKCVRGR